MKQLVINLIQEDIDNGECMNPFDCPISKAVNRLYPISTWNPDEYLETITGPTSIRHGNLNQRENYVLPIEAIEFVKNFDNGNYVEPFTFIATKCEE